MTAKEPRVLCGLCGSVITSRVRQCMQVMQMLPGLFSKGANSSYSVCVCVCVEI